MPSRATAPEGAAALAMARRASISGVGSSMFALNAA